MRKDVLRASLRYKRAKMDATHVHAYSLSIHNNLSKLDEVNNAGSLFIYASVGNEVKTHELIDFFLEQNKTITVPKIIRWHDDSKNIAGIMKPYKITNLSQLELKNGFYEPTTEEYPDYLPLDIAIMPCLGLTKEGHRLGMGGGFYDKFIEKYLNMKLIALAYDWQILPNLPIRNHDKLVDIIVTEKRILKRD